MNLPQFTNKELLLTALRCYLNSRHKRFEHDQELMDSASKCAMFLEVNNKLHLLEISSYVTASQLCSLVDRYGRLLYDYRARRNAAWIREDLEHIKYIYQLYDEIGHKHGVHMEMFGSIAELNRAYNIMLSLNIDVVMRPMLQRLDGVDCDWCLHLLREDYDKYSHHLKITGHGY
jgi:hypothetical protein